MGRKEVPPGEFLLCCLRLHKRAGLQEQTRSCIHTHMLAHCNSHQRTWHEQVHEHTCTSATQHTYKNTFCPVCFVRVRHWWTYPHIAGLYHSPMQVKLLGEENERHLVIHLWIIHMQVDVYIHAAWMPVFAVLCSLLWKAALLELGQRKDEQWQSKRHIQVLCSENQIEKSHKASLGYKAQHKSIKVSTLCRQCLLCFF